MECFSGRTENTGGKYKINPKIQYYIQFIGLAFIALLFIIGLQGDIKYFLNKN